MREIKFRAWTGEEMIFVHQLDIYPDSPNCRINNSVASHYDKWPLMQFTGLLDKNGKEIYEGDWVLYWTSRFPEVKLKAKIVYNNYVAAFQISYLNMNDHWVTDDIFPKEFEIIGNIYSNPSLLKP